MVPQGGNGKLPVLVGEVHEGLREPRDRRRGAQGLQSVAFRRSVEKAQEAEDRQLRSFSEPAGVGGDDSEGVTALFFIGAVEVDLMPLADVSAMSAMQEVAEEGERESVPFEVLGRGA